MKTEIYKQCMLRKNNGNTGWTNQIAWIPDEFAKVGKYLELKKRDQENWDNSWKVISVGAELDSSALLAKGRSDSWYGGDSVRKDGVWQPIKS